MFSPRYVHMYMCVLTSPHIFVSEVRREYLAGRESSPHLLLNTWTEFILLCSFTVCLRVYQSDMC